MCVQKDGNAAMEEATAGMPTIPLNQGIYARESQ